ncbi:MAG: peroxide stress protein YaaA [Undibacterium sp.]|nr:peroxide stress protein YaaA [Undibacterium sp.]
MLIVLSPAKSLDYETPVSHKKSSDPYFVDDAATLIEKAKTLNVEQLAQLMKISPVLAKLNVERFENWSRYPDKNKTRAAVFAFNGDVYEGLDVKTLNATQLSYLQTHLRILSGLYGLLRPLDLIQAYRLEMGSQLENSRGKNLYSFWGTKITDMLNSIQQEQKCKVILNLASEEYFKVIKPSFLKVPVITPVFQDYKNGEYKIISFFAKRARGLMVRYCALNKIYRPEMLKLFDKDGYSYCEEVSDSQRWVFRRKVSL